MVGITRMHPGFFLQAGTPPEGPHLFPSPKQFFSTEQSKISPSFFSFLPPAFSLSPLGRRGPRKKPSARRQVRGSDFAAPLLPAAVVRACNLGESGAQDFRFVLQFNRKKYALYFKFCSQCKAPKC